MRGGPGFAGPADRRQPGTGRAWRTRTWCRPLLASGGLALAAAACAQASRDLATRPPSPWDRDALFPTPVVLYGLLNAGWLKQDDALRRTGGEVGSTERSRLGLRATEILGGPLLAHLHLEQSFRADDGSLRIEGKSFDARATVGLSHRELGRIDLGRMEQAASALVLRADPWGGTTAVGPGARPYTVNAQGDTRSSGVLAWTSREDRPLRAVLQLARPGPDSAERPGHGGSLAWDRLPWLAGVGWQHTHDGARQWPLVLGHDDGTRRLTIAWTEGRSVRAGGPELRDYGNLFLGLRWRWMGLGDPDRHEWRAGLDLHRVHGDDDGRLGSDSKLGVGWRYRYSRHTWTNVGAAWIKPRQGPERWGLEATLSYSFERDLRVPQGPR